MFPQKCQVFLGEACGLWDLTRNNKYAYIRRGMAEDTIKLLRRFNKKSKEKRNLLWHLSTVQNVGKKFQIRQQPARIAELQFILTTKNSANFVAKRSTRNALYALNVESRSRSFKKKTAILLSTITIRLLHLQIRWFTVAE